MIDARSPEILGQQQRQVYRDHVLSLTVEGHTRTGPMLCFSAGITLMIGAVSVKFRLTATTVVLDN